MRLHGYWRNQMTSRPADKSAPLDFKSEYEFWHEKAGQEHVRAEKAEAELAALKGHKDGAYAERDQLVCALSKLFPASLERHPDSDITWANDWRWVVFIDIPVTEPTVYGDARNVLGPCYETTVKQVSWHIHDSELGNFDHLLRLTGKVWDGHTTPEKYARLAALSATPAQPEYDPRKDPATNWVLEYAIELERIQESRNHVLTDEHGNKSPVLTRGTIIDTIWKYLARGVAEPTQWVSIEERLPDEDEKVLITVLEEVDDHGRGEFVKSRLVVRGILYKGGDVLYADTDEGEFEDGDIIAWQPLPQPPVPPAQPANQEER